VGTPVDELEFPVMEKDSSDYSSDARNVIKIGNDSTVVEL